MIPALVPVLGLCLLVLGATTTVQAAADPKRIAAAEADLKTVQGRIEALGERLSEDRNAQDRLQAAVETLERGISQAQGELKRLHERIRSQQAEVQVARAERDREQAQLQSQQAALAQHIRAAHRMGARAQARLLLSQEDAQGLSRLMTYYDYLNRAHSRRIQDIDTRVQRLAEVEGRLQAAEEDSRRLVEQQALGLRQLEASRAERQRAIAEVDARIRDSGEALKRLQEDEQQMRALLGSLRDILADVPLTLGNSKPFPQLRGRLYRPVTGSRLLARYGQPKAGTTLNWKGLWMAAPTGAPVRAAAGGRVAYVGWMHRYGLMVILEHDSDYFTLYGHNESASVRLGQWVQAGETLAQAGASGGHRQSGVYFEIRRGRSPIDPRPWLSK